MLVTRLGLRGIDIKRLKFSDFDWPGNRLSVVQAKTGRRVWLPLLKDVGWAVIDYVRSGRPVSDCRQVFLRHIAPIPPGSKARQHSRATALWSAVTWHRFGWSGRIRISDVHS